MFKVSSIVFLILVSTAHATTKTDYSKCLNPVNTHLGQMTDMVNVAQPLDFNRMPLQLNDDGTFKVNNLEERQGKLVKDGKKGTLTAPSYFLDRSTGKPIKVTTSIAITYDDKDRIQQIEERPNLEKRKALGAVMGANQPANEMAYGIRLTYNGNDCAVDQSYSAYMDAGKKKFIESILYDRKVCEDLKPALARLDRQSLNKCNSLMSEMGRALANRQQALAAQDKEFMTINMYGQKIPQNPFMFTLTVALSCRAMNSGLFAPDIMREQLDVDDKGSSADDATATK